MIDTQYIDDDFEGNKTFSIREMSTWKYDSEKHPRIHEFIQKVNRKDEVRKRVLSNLLELRGMSDIKVRQSLYQDQDSELALKLKRISKTIFEKSKALNFPNNVDAKPQVFVYELAIKEIIALRNSLYERTMKDEETYSYLSNSSNEDIINDIIKKYIPRVEKYFGICGLVA